jgi:hypothetical protein
LFADVSRRMSFRRTALLAVAAVAAIAYVSWWAATAPPYVAAAAPGVPPHAVVVSAGTRVERSAGDGGWTAARVGDALGPADAIRTAQGDKAELSLGRGTTVVVDERSEVVLRELAPAGHRIRLLRGRVDLDHRFRDGARTVRVEDASGTILATSGGGRWSAVASPDALAVTAVEGAVRLESAGAAVEVPAGTQSAAWRGVAPIAPARPVPRAVVLRVARELADRRKDACASLQVDVASEVEVNGESVPVDREGRVVVMVPEARHRLPVDVVVRHVTGAVERRRIDCVEDAADVKALEVRWNDR